MSVTVNATGTKLYHAAATTVDYTGITVAAGANSALAALWMIDAALPSPSAVTAVWDPVGANQALTQIVMQEHGTLGRSSWIFALSGEHGALATGNKILRLSWTTSVPFFLVAMSFDGVNQTGGATSFPNAVSGGTPTLSVTSATGDEVIACEASGASQGVSTGTLIFDDHASGSVINAMCQYDSGAASVSIGNSGTNNTIVACDIFAAAVSGASLRRNSSLDGLGASGPFFHDPLARSMLGWRKRASLWMPQRKLVEARA